MSDAINMEQVTVQRGETTLLSAVDLRVPEGSFVAIVGPNGSGKTTLLKTLLGLADPFGGVIHLMGNDASTLEPRERAAKVAWLPQKDFTAEPMAVLDFVMTSRYRFRESRDDSVAAARDALRQVRLEQLEARLVSTLSGGECQRVSAACLLAQASPILLADEPGNHLDPSQQLQIYTLLGEQWRAGKTVVCVTHDVNLLRHVGALDALADVRVLGLSQGSRAFDLSLTDDALGGSLSDLFGVEFAALAAGDGPHFGISARGAGH
jgi:iron complex transport system ATP-binding protein